MRCRVIGVLCKAAGSKGDSHSSSMERLSHLQTYFTIIMPLLSVNVPILYPHFAGEKIQAQRGKVVCPEAHSQNGKSRVRCLPVVLRIINTFALGVILAAGCPRWAGCEGPVIKVGEGGLGRGLTS